MSEAAGARDVSSAIVDLRASVPRPSDETRRAAAAPCQAALRLAEKRPRNLGTRRV
jgi:hypothetical protein